MLDLLWLRQIASLTSMVAWVHAKVGRGLTHLVVILGANDVTVIT
jgi:hypothetical protein